MYDASGAKLRKYLNNNSTIDSTDYVNGVEYQNNILDRIPHTEGEIVKNTAGTYVYEYTLKDHPVGAGSSTNLKFTFAPAGKGFS